MNLYDVVPRVFAFSSLVSSPSDESIVNYSQPPFTMLMNNTRNTLSILIIDNSREKGYTLW